MNRLIDNISEEKYLSLFDRGIIAHFRNMAHYRWEARLYGEKERFNIKYNQEKIKNFLLLLCEIFEIEKPKINFMYGLDGRAETFVCDKKISFTRSACTPIAVIHEFIHWYYGIKYQVIDTHNMPYAKKLQRRLIWLTRSYWKYLEI